MNKMRYVLVMVLAACSNSPSGPPSFDSSADVLDGVWTYQVGTMQGQNRLPPNLATSIACSTTGRLLALAQNGTTFSGMVAGGLVTCSTNGRAPNTWNMSGTTRPIINGSIQGTTVTFDFDSPDWRSTGTLNGNTITGTVRVRMAELGDDVIMTGNFTAAK